MKEDVLDFGKMFINLIGENNVRINDNGTLNRVIMVKNFIFNFSLLS